jgi:hypothetical protein
MLSYALLCTPMHSYALLCPPMPSQCTLASHAPRPPRPLHSMHPGSNALYGNKMPSHALLCTPMHSYALLCSPMHSYALLCTPMPSQCTPMHYSLPYAPCTLCTPGPMHYMVIKCLPTALKIPKYTTLTYALYALLMHNPNAPPRQPVHPCTLFALLCLQKHSCTLPWPPNPPGIKLGQP